MSNLISNARRLNAVDIVTSFVTNSWYIMHAHSHSFRIVFYFFCQLKTVEFVSACWLTLSFALTVNFYRILTEPFYVHISLKDIDVDDVLTQIRCDHKSFAVKTSYSQNSKLFLS